MSSQQDNRQANLTRGIRVEIASLVYNIIEVVVSVTVGLLTGSAALVSWGLDSTVEATSAATLIWRLKGEKDGAEKRTVLHRKKVALYVVACAFWIVVAAILYEAVSAFLSQKAPGFNWWGIAILGASLVVNPFLAWGKYRYGKRLDAPALKYDAKDTMICQYQTIVVLAGIGLTQWMGWWWADPVAAGQTGCEGTEWESETSVRCLVGQGGGGTRGMTISAVQRVESVSQVFSLDASAITIGPGASNGAVTGGQILTISGDGFGYGSEGNRNAASAKASVGHSNCMFTRWISDSSLLCKLPAGSYCAVGPVVVTASVQLGSFTASFSYDPPTLAAISAGGTMPSGSGTSLGISCVRYTGRHAKCWGNNGFGQLGQGNTNSLGNAANTMGDNFDVISLGSGRTITEMQTGCGGARKHVCVIMDNGQANHGA